MFNKSSYRTLISLALLILSGFFSAQAFEAGDYFGDATLNYYSADIGFCFRITVEDDNLQIVDNLCFGNVANLAEKNDINSELLEVSGTNFSHFLAANKKWQYRFYESKQDADWTLVILNSGTLTFTRLGPADKVIPTNATLTCAVNGQPDSPIDIVDGRTLAVSAGQTWNISYRHTVRSTTEKSVTYAFAPGWNLLSLPIVVYPDSRRENDNWDELLALRPLTLAGKTFVRSDDLRCGEAFWVFYKGQLSDSEDKLTIAGFEPLTSEWPKHTTNGWNFLGTVNQTATDIFSWNNSAERYQAATLTEAAAEEEGYWSR